MIKFVHTLKSCKSGWCQRSRDRVENTTIFWDFCIRISLLRALVQCYTILLSPHVSRGEKMHGHFSTGNFNFPRFLDWVLKVIFSKPCGFVFTEKYSQSSRHIDWIAVKHPLKTARCCLWMLEARLRGWHLFDGKVGWMMIWPVSRVNALDMAAVVTRWKISNLGCLSSKDFGSLSTLIWLGHVDQILKTAGLQNKLWNVKRRWIGAKSQRTTSSKHKEKPEKAVWIEWIYDAFEELTLEGRERALEPR